MIGVAFRALPIVWKLVSVGALVVTIGGGLWGVYNHIEGKGYDRAIAEIEAANTEGVNNAVEHVKKRRACAGTWSQSRGVCE